MDSSFSNSESNLDPSSSLESSRKKRRKIDTGAHSGSQDDTAAEAAIIKNRARWRTDATQQIYSSKLVEALRHVRRNSSPADKPPGGGRLVRETADRVLAVAARGRTRWSRAILTRRLSRRLSKHRKAKIAAGGVNRKKIRPEVRSETKKLPAVQKKVKVLGRLVPGCRKLSFPNLLDEASDYIAALEMQVRAMTALTELLAGASESRLGSGSSSSS